MADGTEGAITQTGGAPNTGSEGQGGAPAAPAPVTAESLEAEFAPREAQSGEGEAPAQPSGGTEGDQGAEGAAQPDELAQLRERLAATERERDEARSALPKEPPAQPKQTAPADPDVAPDPAKYDYGEADPKFIADTARWAARQEHRELAEADRMRSNVEAMDAKWQTATAAPEVATRYPDFAQKVVQGADKGDWDCSPLMAIGIKQSPVGVDVAYHLATNPTEASRIAKLSPMEQALELGRMEGRFMSAPKSEQPKQQTQAPPPPAGRARGEGGRFAAAPDTDDFASFEALADGMIR